jgi:hypothetical protein
MGNGCRLVAIGAPGDKERKHGDETGHTRGHVRPPSGFIWLAKLKRDALELGLTRSMK